MTLPELTTLIDNTAEPVILVEGRRSIPVEDFKAARETGEFLATRFPRATFRSGNADGSDQAFSVGIEAVDPTRLHVVAPYEGHRKRHRVADAVYHSPDILTPSEQEELAEQTAAASPGIRGLIARRSASKALAAKARYLMRDTLKVIGHDTDQERPHRFPPVTAALFYVNLADPDAGGTGHTIRVCRQHGVPVAFQDEWATWRPRDDAS